jgi:phage shock protein A
MTLFDRLLQSLSRLFSIHKNSGGGDPVVQAQNIIVKQKKSLNRLKESLTELIFQRKKFEVQLAKMENKRLSLKRDIELAACQDRDDLALRLMEEMDRLVKDLEETRASLQWVRTEVDTAKEVEKELIVQIERSESQLAVLVSRHRAVKVRENLQEQFSKIHDEISELRPDPNGLEESILKLEARLENLQGAKQSWQKEVRRLRQQRTKHFRESRLQQLKVQLKGRQLPGAASLADVVTTH